MPGYIDDPAAGNTLGELYDVELPAPTTGSLMAYSSKWKDSVRAWGIGTTSTIGAALSNTTPATAGVPVQYSPIMAFGGTVWTGTATSLDRMGIQARPNTGYGGYGTLHFVHSLGADAWSSRAYISSATPGMYSTVFSATNRLETTSSMYMYYNNDNSAGLGVVDRFNGSTNDTPTLFANPTRTNGANNIAVGIGWDPGIALASVNDYMVLASFGITDNVNAWNHILDVFPKHLLLPTFTVATAPANPPAGSFGYCSNGDAGSPCLAVGNGTNWLRVALAAAISAT